MLEYKVKPTTETKLSSFPIRELYVSPDLNEISGVTDYNVGLVDGEEVLIKSPYLIGDEANTINAKTVKRQGRVGVTVSLPIKIAAENVKLEIYHTTNGRPYVIEDNQVSYNVTDNENGYVIKRISKKYVKFNGDISYFFELPGTNRTRDGYLIDGKFYIATGRNSVQITSYLPIEDGKLTVGDNVYDVDFSVPSTKPVIRLNKYSDPISGGTFLGKIDGNSYSALTDGSGGGLIEDYNPSGWTNVTKFYIVKAGNPIIKAEDVMYGGYDHYITYNDENYYLEERYNDSGDTEYGVFIDDEFYQMSNNYTDEQIFGLHKDIQCDGCYVFTGSGETDTAYEVNNSLYSSHEAGKFIILINSEERDDITEGNIIEASSYYPINVRKLLQEENGEKYIIYDGKKYVVSDRLFNTITIGGMEYDMVYTGTSSTNNGYCVINGEKVWFDISQDRTSAKFLDKIYYKSGTTLNQKTIVNYGKSPTEFEMNIQSGVTINGVDYPVKKDVRTEYNVEITTYYVDVPSPVNYKLEVSQINGSSAYLCYPICDNDTLTKIEEDEMQREICTSIVDNWKSFEFRLKKTTFGYEEFEPKNFLKEATTSKYPYTVTNNHSLEKSIEILRVQNYLSFKFPIMNNVGTNIMREDVVKNDFVDYVKDKSINSIVDMEKDVYYPVWKDDKKYRPINELVFNLHFRNRNLDNWKVMEDDREFSGQTTPNSEKSNWFVTDYKYYGSISGDVLQNSSDLLGFLNFSTSEIKNAAKKISRSFLRLSYYTTDNPNTQTLLYTSTIFFDENNSLQKYMNLKRNSELVFADVLALQNSDCSGITDSSSNCDEHEKGKISSYTASNFSELVGDEYLTDSLRLSSRFRVSNKYNSEASSDGYYLYLFKEYAKKKHEVTIYLKIEFNHAGIGKSIQFTLPRKDDGTLYRLSKSADVSTMKDGFKMQDIYKQVYIPIKLIYDDNENRYVYYLPNELREQGYFNDNSPIQLNDDVMVFNLFETKFANESIVTAQS